MNVEQQIIVIGGAILALLFEYAPRLRQWYEAQEEGTKKQVMLGALALGTAGIYGLSCTGYVNAVACRGSWDEVLFEAAAALVMAAIANQGTHRITKRSSSN